MAVDDRLVDVGDHRLHVVCQGAGPPTVLVELGAGGTIAAERRLLRFLATRFRTCIYERDGRGQSERGPLPLDAEHVTRDLAALLARADIAAPIVVVAQSLGGLYAQHFAARHPDKVAGIVFVDARTADFQQGYRDLMTPEQLAVDKRLLAEELASGRVPEIASIDDSAMQVMEAGPLPAVPVVVLTAGAERPEPSDEVHALWQLTHRRLAAQSPHGRHMTVQEASHSFLGHEAAILEAIVAVSRG
jgi:pimeloyl-ACP methyl ester carboxylesterase